MKNFKRFQDQIKKVGNILITTHIFPDADGIGSQLALAMALEKLGKKVTCLNEDPLPERYHYLDKNKLIKTVKSYKKGQTPDSFDMVIVVDTHNIERVGPSLRNHIENTKEIFYRSSSVTKELQALNIIDSSMAATGQLVAHLIEFLKVELTHEMALCLYTAIIIDTSSFRYPSVNGDTHIVISKLIKAGVRPSMAYNKIYGAKKIAHMHLLGELLKNAQCTEDQNIAWIVVGEKHLKKYNIDPEDTHAFINHLLILKNIKVAIMFREIGKMVKISMRSNLVDVAILAQALGGGGHNHAAAALKEGKLKNIIKETVEKINLMLLP